jgi:hypothetical protein
VNLADGTVVGHGQNTGTDTLRSIEGITGTEFADIFNAGATIDNPGGFTAFSTNAGSAGVNSGGKAFNEFEGRGGDDIITGNGNTRIAFYDAKAGVTVILAEGAVHGTAHSTVVLGDPAGIGTDDIVSGVNRVRGSEFDDNITGNSSRNILDGRGGDDMLTGNGGNDTFVYSTGADTIADFDSFGGLFNHAQGDSIDLTGSGVTSWAQLQALMSQINSGADTLLDFGNGNTITLIGITAADAALLTAADFTFDPVRIDVETTTGYDMHGLYGDIGSGFLNLANETATSFDAINGGHTFHVVGTGFNTYGVNGPTSGTVTEIDILDTATSNTLVIMTGFFIDAGALTAAADAFSSTSNAGPLTVIFNQYWYEATGNAGNDVLPGFINADNFDGGGGTANTVDYVHYGSAITVDLADPSLNTGNAAGDTYADINSIIGTNFNDTLIGDGNINTLEGGAGADMLYGGGGLLDFASYIHAPETSPGIGVTANLANAALNTGDAAGDIYFDVNGLLGSNYDDTLTGDANDNYLRGRGGADALDGGGGSDTADYNFSPAAVRADLSDPSTNTGWAFGDTYTSIENLRGSNFGDTLKGDTGDNVLTGLGGADTFIYSAGADTIADFKQGQGDTIDLTDSGVTTFADLQALMSQMGADTLIDFGGGNTMTLIEVAFTDLHASDFILSP